MVEYTAGWGGIGTLLLVVFVVLPSIRWSVGFGTRYGTRWGRRFGGSWAGLDDDRPRGGKAREIAALRAELDDKLAEVDHLSARVAELENRLDFTERLLTQRTSEPVTAPPIGDPSR